MEATIKTKIGTKGKLLHSQAREIVANVMTFMQDEAHNGVKIPLENFKRVLAATGISDKLYRSISQEKENIETHPGTSFSTPKKAKVAPRKSKLPEGELNEIREIIYKFYSTEKRRPSLKGILQKIEDSGLSFDGSVSTLWRLLKQMGFKWKKCSDNRKMLVESYDIRLKRIEYLKSITIFREQGRPIVYTDETYLHSSHSQSKDWTDEAGKSLKVPVSKGRRLIIAHAGGEMGFIPKGLLMFRSGQKSGDYHDDMNHTNFEKWITQQILPNLPPQSVLVLDNASYHNVKVELEPTTASKKAEMIEWLRNKNITVNELLTKAELYAIIKQYKQEKPKYRLDEMLKQHGHDVLRLPPYHPELNPIEKMWATVKNYVASRNITFKLNDVEDLARDKFNSVTVEEWKALCYHVIKEEKELIKREHVFDETLDNLCFTVNSGSSSADDLDEESDDFE